MKIVHLRQQLDTTVDPQNKHTIEDQGCLWTTPLNNCLAAVFFHWVSIRNQKFWEIGYS